MQAQPRDCVRPPPVLAKPFVALTMCLLIAGCGGNGDEPSPSPTDPSPPPVGATPTPETPAVSELLQAFRSALIWPGASAAQAFPNSVLMGVEMMTDGARDLAEGRAGAEAPRPLSPASAHPIREVPRAWSVRTDPCPLGGSITSADTGDVFTFTAAACRYSAGLSHGGFFDGWGDVSRDTGGMAINMDARNDSTLGAERSTLRLVLDRLRIGGGGGSCTHQLTLNRALLDSSGSGGPRGDFATLMELSDAVSQMAAEGEICTWAFSGRFGLNSRSGAEPAVRHDVRIDTETPLRYMAAPAGATRNPPVGGRVVIQGLGDNTQRVTIEPDAGGVQVDIDGGARHYLTHAELEALGADD